MRGRVTDGLRPCVVNQEPAIRGHDSLLTRDGNQGSHARGHLDAGHRLGAFAKLANFLHNAVTFPYIAAGGIDVERHALDAFRDGPEHVAHLLAWGVQSEMTVARMLEMPFYHPVVEEGLRTALRDAAAKLEARWQQRERRAA